MCANLNPAKRACIWTLSILLLIGVVGVTGAKGQAGTAMILGTATDSSGGVVAGARVDVKNIGTGVVQSSVTDVQGRYSVPELAIGDYQIQTTMTGFETAVHSGITLTVGSHTVVDFTLKVGQTTNSVTVEGHITQVETTTADLSNLVEPKQMVDLPLNGRNFEQLISLAPGVQATNGAGGQGSFYGNGTNYSVAGSRPEGEAFLLDNANISNFWNHGTGSGPIGSSLGIEAIAEFQTLTNTYSAQFGGNGAVVNAVTKSGTNSLHGSVYEFLRNSALDAHNFFDGPKVPTFRRNQFGGSLGGPIKKDKAFFFVNYEGLRQLLGQSVPSPVPDAAAHSYLLPVVDSMCAVTISPVTRNANSATSTAIDNALALYPIPAAANEQTVPCTPMGSTTSVQVPTGIGLYTAVGSQIAHENYVLGRFDYVFSTKDSLFVRYVSDRADFVAPFGDSLLGLWPERDLTRNEYLTIEERRIVSPTLLNMVRFSFVRPTESATVSKSFPALQFFPGSGREDGQVSIGGAVAILGATATLPFNLIPNRFVVGDDVIWTHGAHSFHFGVSLERIRDNTNAPFMIGGVFNFDNLMTFVQGKSSFVSGALPGQSDAARDFRELQITPYFQDEWRITPRLTLNLGVRYDWAANPSAVRHPLNALVDAPNGTALVLVTHIFASNPSTKNWDPRIGLAYDPFADHKTSIRAGFGMFRDVIGARTFAPAYWLAPPFAIGFQLNPPYPNPFASGGSAPQLTERQRIDYHTTNTPYMMQYNLNVEREILSGTVLDVGYVGSRGIHLIVTRDYNPPVPVIDSNGTYHFADASLNTFPRINPALGFLLLKNTNGYSNYNSLQVSLSRRFSRNVQAQLSYTYSRSMDDGSQTYNLEGTNATDQSFENPYNYNGRLDYARSSFDRAHSLRMSGVVALPFHTNKFVDGWQLSGIASVTTGPPFSLLLAPDQAGLGGATGERPDIVPGCDPTKGGGTPNQWFNSNCFSLPAPGTLGNLGRNTLIGPGLVNVDFAVLKDTKIRKISEQFDVQFRAEIFNIFNHPNFDLPTKLLFGGSGVVPGDGQILGTLTTSRQTQFALNFLF